MNELATIEPELPELSPRDQAFANAVLEGYTYTDAAKQTNPSCAKWQQPAIRVYASRQAAKPEVQAYIETCRRLGMQQAARSIEGYVAKLERIEALAIQDKQYTAATRAAELNGRATGMLGAGTNEPLLGVLGPDELVLAARVKLGSEAGRRMAMSLGLLEEAAPVTIDGEAVEVTEPRSRKR